MCVPFNYRTVNPLSAVSLDSLSIQGAEAVLTELSSPSLWIFNPLIFTLIRS